MITEIKRMFLNTIDLFRLTRAEVLADLINENNYSSYAEIGIWRGCTAKYLLRKCNLNKLICVDNYKCNNNMYSIKMITEAKNKSNVLRTNPRVVFYELSSKEASKQVEDNSLDIIFIDADHSYDSIKEDIDLWYPKVRKGGILCGHSYRIWRMGVVRAVSERFLFFDVRDDNVWVVKK